MEVRGSSLIIWSAILVSGGSVLYLLSRVLHNKPALVVSDEGIYYLNWPVGMIPWSDLRDAFVRSDGGKVFVCLSLLHPEEYRGRMSGFGRFVNSAARATGFGDFTLETATLGLESDVVLKLVTAEIRRAQGKA